MDRIERVNRHFLDSIDALNSGRELLSTSAAAAADRIVAALMQDHKVLACGNGGSAAIGQYFASQMVGRFEKERPGLAALALAPDAAALTAVASTYDWELVFSKQIRALGQPGDVLLAMSTGGSADNVVEAVHAAHERQMTVIALTGDDGGRLAELLAGEDIHLHVPVERSARVLELHLLLLNAICDAIDYILLDGE